MVRCPECQKHNHDGRELCSYCSALLRTENYFKSAVFYLAAVILLAALMMFLFALADFFHS
jgi:hypothetical protein